MVKLIWETDNALKYENGFFIYFSGHLARIIIHLTKDLFLPLDEFQILNYEADSDLMYIK